MTSPARLFALVLICLLAVPALGASAPALPEVALAEAPSAPATTPAGEEPQTPLPSAALSRPAARCARAPGARLRLRPPAPRRCNRPPSHAPPAPSA